MDDAFLNRRAELLYLARKSRLQWITAAENACTDILPARSVEMDSMLSALPAMKCLEDVLGFLTDLSGDTESVQLSSLVNTHVVPDEEEEEDELPSFSNMDAYSVFITKLKRRSATDIVKSMQVFVQGIEIEMREATYSGSVQDKLQGISDSIWVFHKKTLARMRENACWERESTEEWIKTKESLEIFLLSKLHSTLFIEDIHGDLELYDRIQTLKFLSPEHLDIKSIVGDGAKVLQRPVQVLREGLSLASNPISKVQCLRECSAAISKSLMDFKKNGSFPGADEFLPVLILTIKEANPAQLKSNMNYILLFTDPAKLTSETGYLLTQFVSAVQFLETVDASALSISPLEFEMAVARCRFDYVNLTAFCTTTDSSLIEICRSDARKMSEDFERRNDRLGASAFTAPEVEAPAGVIHVKTLQPSPKQTDKSAAAIDLLMKRRKYSYLHNDSRRHHILNQGADDAVGSLEQASGSGAEECRLALARAFDRYDSDVHSRVLSAFCSGVPLTFSNGISVPIVSNSVFPTLNYVSAPVETLSVADVSKLLAEYKALAKVCAVLVSEHPNTPNVKIDTSGSRHISSKKR